MGGLKGVATQTPIDFSKQIFYMVLLYCITTQSQNGTTLKKEYAILEGSRYSDLKTAVKLKSATLFPVF